MPSRRLGYALIGRLALLLLAGLVLAASVLVALSALRLTPLHHLTFAGVPLTIGLSDLPLLRRALWLLGAAGGALVGLLVLALALLRSEERGFVLRQGSRDDLGGGSLIVSARSVRALAAHAAHRVQDVLEADTRVRSSRKGWRVDLWVVASRRAALPEMAKHLEVAIGDALRDHTGIPVGRLRIWAQLDPLGKKTRVQ